MSIMTNFTLCLSFGYDMEEEEFSCIDSLSFYLFKREFPLAFGVWDMLLHSSVTFYPSI